MQAQAEETDAVAQLKRNQDLLAKGFVSAASVDTAKARADRAVAAVAPDVELEARHLDLALEAIRSGRRRQQLPRAVWIVIDRRRLWVSRAP